jgi:hypothetical protein
MLFTGRNDRDETKMNIIQEDEDRGLIDNSFIDSLHLSHEKLD